MTNKFNKLAQLICIEYYDNLTNCHNICINEIFYCIKNFKIIFLECVILYMEVILTNKKRFKKKKTTDIILKVAESINFLIMSCFFLF